MTLYVPKELFEEWAKRDPIERFRSWLRENAEMTDEEEDEVAAGVKRTLTQAIERAETSPPGSLDGHGQGVPEDLAPHHK